jgi:hypothetical protein
MTSDERPGYDISIHALKYALTTLIQGVASALRHQLLEHTSHCFYSIHQIIQLASFSWESVRQRSEARVISRKPKNKCRISANVKPS